MLVPKIAHDGIVFSTGGSGGHGSEITIPLLAASLTALPIVAGVWIGTPLGLADWLLIILGACLFLFVAVPAIHRSTMFVRVRLSSIEGRATRTCISFVRFERQRFDHCRLSIQPLAIQLTGHSWGGWIAVLAADEGPILVTCAFSEHEDVLKYCDEIKRLAPMIQYE